MQDDFSYQETPFDSILEAEEKLIREAAAPPPSPVERLEVSQALGAGKEDEQKVTDIGEWAEKDFGCSDSGKFANLLNRLSGIETPEHKRLSRVDRVWRQLRESKDLTEGL